MTGKVSLMIPCFNEEATIGHCVLSCLRQTRKADQIIVIDDSSTDKTPEILASFGDSITVVKTPKNSGNKSYAQEYGLTFVTGEIVIMTDGDTLLDARFIEEIIKEFDNPKIVAAGGYIRSMKCNWLTRCRAFDYAIGQNFFKLAQSCLGFLLVIPGAAGAFRTDVFRKYLTFDHDTITEDLDFTYKLNGLGFRIAYSRKAIVLTQDPASLKSYINQMRRWFGGGWQNLVKHRVILLKPQQAFELSLIYVESFVFSALLFIVPLVNIRFSLAFSVPYMVMIFVFSIYAAFKERRPDIMLVAPWYVLVMHINAYIFIEQFVKEVVMRRKNLIWLKPDRVRI